MTWIIYLIIGAIHLLGIILNSFEIQMYSKIVMMPSLALAWWSNNHRKKPLIQLVLVSIFFSWLGDLFLLNKEPILNFALGLTSFLIAHVLYIKVFIGEVGGRQKFGFVQSKPFLILPFVLYGILLLYLVFPNLGVMKLPVILYSAVLLTMSILALNRYRTVLNMSFAMVFLGSLLFVFSDSMIALNQFYYPFKLSRFLIMSTYIAAQYFIVRGLTFRAR